MLLFFFIDRSTEIFSFVGFLFRRSLLLPTIDGFDYFIENVGDMMLMLNKNGFQSNRETGQ